LASTDDKTVGKWRALVWTSFLTYTSKVSYEIVNLVQVSTQNNKRATGEMSKMCFAMQSMVSN